MRELSLFSGAGGGLLGTHLLGWEPVGYVEFDDYCQRVIAARIRDGILPGAPIYGDIRAFIGEGYAASYTGLVDVITAGFPCQPFSTAGKRAGEDDERNMWPATIECIRVVRPRWCLLENVPGLLSSGYFGTVLGDLAQSGYDARWRVLSAAEVGAPHRRNRLWIVATDAASQRENGKHRDNGGKKSSRHKDIKEFNSSSKTKLADAEQGGWDGWAGEPGQGRWPESQDGGSEPADAGEAGLAQWCGQEGQRAYTTATGASWWATEPDVGRVVDGLAYRVDRLKALGNGQVPIVAATVWGLLTGGVR